MILFHSAGVAIDDFIAFSCVAIDDFIPFSCVDIDDFITFSCVPIDDFVLVYALDLVTKAKKYPSRHVCARFCIHV